jgi:hypothetical protein
VVATISSTGSASAIGAGDADIKATYQGVSGTAHITVTAPSPPPPPPPTTFNVCGTVKEDSGGAAIASASVNVEGTSNAATSDASGKYCVSGLNPGTVLLRATKSGYDTAERQVTVTGNMTLDIAMHNQAVAPPPPPTPDGTCSAATIPSNAVCIDSGKPPATAVCVDGAYSCSQNRSGSCSGHGGVKCWVCPGLLCNGQTIASGVLFSPAYGGYSPVTSSDKR